MRAHALRARPRRRGLPKDEGERLAPAFAPNVLDRQFKADRPGFRCGLLPIRQERHGSSPFQIADDRPVAMIAPPRPVVDPNDGEPLHRKASAPAHDTLQRVVAHRNYESSGKTGSRSSAEREPKMMNKAI